MPRTIALGLVLCLPLTCPLQAQTMDPATNPTQHQHDHQPDHASAPNAWTIAGDGNAFFGYNYQSRHFADYTAWESQNWFGLTASRETASSRLSVEGMITLEPFTMDGQGSPQLFQTGESYRQIPLVNYQHPHDLIMGLGVTWRLPRTGATYVLGADLVGTPTLGPTPFMHRESARDNPQVPLTHHFLDSTHSTPGVVRAGVEVGEFTFESSVFRGEGPDENRRDLEEPRLNSWAVRVQWRRGPWSAQMSGGHLKQPEWFEPFDATRLTASMSFEGSVKARPLAATLAWGQNRQFNGFNGIVDGFLLEGTLRAASLSTVYGRAEVAAKELFGLGPHPKEFAHRHWFSEVGAYTAGYIQDLPFTQLGRVGIGADITLYRVPSDLVVYYEGSRSFHVFLRWRPSGPPAHMHSH